MNPSENVRRFIEEKLYPDLEKLGFKFSAKSLTIYRRVGNFNQEIHFPKHKRNEGDEVVKFDLIFNITFPGYKKFHKQEYGIEALNEGVAGNRAIDIQNWNLTFYETGWYDLAVVNEKDLKESIISNILGPGIDFLNAYSTPEKAIKTTFLSKSYYFRCPLLFDLAFILQNKELATDILKWYDDYMLSGDKTMNENTQKNVEIRKLKLKEWV